MGSKSHVSNPESIRLGQLPLSIPNGFMPSPFRHNRDLNCMVAFLNALDHIPEEREGSAHVWYLLCARNCVLSISHELRGQVGSSITILQVIKLRLR